MRRFFKNNQGMTLIELLVAIIILGFVATPLLHGFLTSAQTQVKARKMGEVTNVAQNVMEIVEGNTFEDIVVDRITNSYGIFETPTNNNVDEHYYSLISGSYRPVGSDNRRPNDEDYHIGLKNYKYAGKTYEIMVDIAASGYDEINNQDKLSVYSEMDYAFSEVPETPVVPDLFNVGRYTIPARTITLNVTKETIDRREYATVKAECQFDVIPLKYELGTYRFQIKNDEEPSLYLFYHPSYTKHEGSYILTPDKIKINNQDDVRFDLYIMKQRNAGLSELDLIDLEDQYVCDVQQSMTNYQRSQGKVGAEIYTNLEENLGGSNSRKPYVRYVVDHIRLGVNVNTVGTLNPFQTEVEARKRIYEVTVKVYEDSSNMSGEPLGTLTGAILK